MIFGGFWGSPGPVHTVRTLTMSTKDTKRPLSALQGSQTPGIQFVFCSDQTIPANRAPSCRVQSRKKRDGRTSTNWECLVFSC